MKISYIYNRCTEEVCISLLCVLKYPVEKSICLLDKRCYVLLLPIIRPF